MKKRMLITGISGLLGSNIAFYLKDVYEILGIYHTHRVEVEGIRTKEVDLTSEDSLCSLIEEFDPKIVLHCAAQADVDICEDYPQQAEKINVQGTRDLIKNLDHSKTKIIFISTDLVYDGVKGYFSEEDLVNPLNYYGKTKCEIEKEVMKIKNSLVLRTNFFGWNIQEKCSLGEWVIKELANKNEIQGFKDCIFSAIYICELAKILDCIIKKDLSGIYNCASSTSISKYEFAVEIANRLDLDTNLINPISIDDFDFKAKRGRNLSLNVNKLAENLSIDIPPISYSIELFVEDFKRKVPKIIKSYQRFKNIYPVPSDNISYGCQSIDDDDITAVVEVLKSESITQGLKVREFQSALCQVTDASFAVAVNSGTSALHIACLAVGISFEDEVITSPNSFVASANCVVYCGGNPVFTDIDLSTYNMLPQEIENNINERTKAVIPVHFAGQSCDMEAIKDIVCFHEKKYGHKIYIIEDACHALGSYYRQTKVGSCVYSDMAVMSFHPVKHITTGEGGVVLTDDKELRRKLSYFRSHGITSDPEEFLYTENAFDEGQGFDDELKRRTWYYEQNCLGYNYRITDIQCALGISQLKKLDIFFKRRKEIVCQYNAAFEGIEPLTIPFEVNFCNSNFHLYVLKIDFEKIKITRAQFMQKLRDKGIQTQVHYIPIYTQPFYRERFGFQWGTCLNVEKYYKQCLSIPLYPQMTQSDVDKVIFVIKETIRTSSKVS